MVVVQLELLRVETRREELHELSAIFLERYVARRGLEDATRIPIQAALILLKRACKRFRYQDETGWEATARRQIACAAALAERQDGGELRSLDDLLALAARFPSVA